MKQNLTGNKGYEKNQFDCIKELNNCNVVDFYKNNDISLLTIKNILTNFDNKNMLCFLNYGNDNNIKEHKNYILKYFYSQIKILDENMLKGILLKMKERLIINKEDIPNLEKLYGSGKMKDINFIDQFIFELKNN